MLDQGLYEQIINKMFEEKLSNIDKERFYVGKRGLRNDEVSKLLSMYLSTIIETIFNNSFKDDDKIEASSTSSVSKSIDLANSIINKLVTDFNLDDGKQLSTQAQVLTAIIDKTQSNYPDLSQRLEEIMPKKGLISGELFTGKGGSTLESELQREISSADEIQLMVSFIKLSGLSLLLPRLKEFTERGGILKVITTTYMQATDFKAISQLSKLKNTEIKITYDTSRERLHAKAYIFIRKTGFNTAYIGSSNISRPALDNGAEWNIKVTQYEQPRMMTTIIKAFDASWQTPDYETYRADIDENKLKLALGITTDGLNFNVLELIRPYDYQQEILERLKFEREVRGHWKNLVVAATGTGKTVIAASDYKAFAQTGCRSRLLFIAHREEILKQSLVTFRQVLCDYNFGEKWFGGEEPSNYEYVFASKDTLNNRLSKLKLPSDYYDFIVIDEVHHVAANSYRKILDHFKPKILLGLTATPERMDGIDITEDFDGTISAEIRLDDALNKGLLAPFHYYGITDSVDYTEVKWEKGRYEPAELTKIYTRNDARTEVVLSSLKKYVADLTKVRALCFCVSQEHADFMKWKFKMCGLKAEMLTSENSSNRNKYYKMLKNMEINYLFVVDMFNEGVDIPEIDTVLFLRPTESLTVFIQQFGRGLRKAEGKTHVKIFDYVGNCRADFNYTDRMRTILGRTSMSVGEEIERDCPHLPIGCKVLLEPKAKEYILKNVRQAIQSFSISKINRLVKSLSKDGSIRLTLENFLNYYNLPVDKIYKKNTWNQTLCAAGISNETTSFNDELALAVYKKWYATDSHSYLTFIKDLAQKSFCIDVNKLSEVDRKRLLMLYYDLFNDAGRFNNLQEMVDTFAADKCFCNELNEVIPLILKNKNAYEKEDNSGIADFPLKLHGVYTKAQIQVAIGTSTLERKSPAREGVERNKKLNVEAMFVDIIKDREVGSSTDYDDKAISPYVFQWDTQNRVSPESREGQAYINDTQTMLLFVREQNKFPEDKTRTMGYVYLGKVTKKDWKYKNLGNRFQMQINWNMLEPIPGSVMHYARIREIA